MTADPPAAQPDPNDGPDEHHVPAWLTRLFEGLWRWVTGTKLGLAVFVVLVYAIPYTSGLLAIGGQVKSGGEFAVLATVGLVASTYASAQPAPTPTMGTLSMILTGFMGAYFNPVAVGLLAGSVGTLGLVTSYGVGATGVGRLLFERVNDKPAIKSAIEKAFEVTKRYGATGILVLALIPTPIYAWSSVAAGSSGIRFRSYFIAAFTGSVVRFVAIAFLGVGIEKLLS